MTSDDVDQMRYVLQGSSNLMDDYSIATCGTNRCTTLSLLSIQMLLLTQTITTSTENTTSLHYTKDLIIEYSAELLKILGTDYHLLWYSSSSNIESKSVGIGILRNAVYTTLVSSDVYQLLQYSSEKECAFDNDFPESSMIGNIYETTCDMIQTLLVASDSISRIKAYRSVIDELSHSLGNHSDGKEEFPMVKKYDLKLDDISMNTSNNRVVSPVRKRRTSTGASINTSGENSDGGLLDISTLYNAWSNSGGNKTTIPPTTTKSTLPHFNIDRINTTLTNTSIYDLLHILTPNYDTNIILQPQVCISAEEILPLRPGKSTINISMTVKQK